MKFNKLSIKAVPWLRRLVAGLSPRRPGFDAGSVNVGFVVDKVALGQVFPRVLRFIPVNFIPPVLHYKEKRKQSSSSQGCTISLKAAVRPWHLLRGPSQKNYRLMCWNLILSWGN
jgi:hypothetical protein